MVEAKEMVLEGPSSDMSDFSRRAQASPVPFLVHQSSIYSSLRFVLLMLHITSNLSQKHASRGLGWKMVTIGLERLVQATKREIDLCSYIESAMCYSARKGVDCTIF